LWKNKGSLNAKKIGRKKEIIEEFGRPASRPFTIRKNNKQIDLKFL